MFLFFFVGFVSGAWKQNKKNHAKTEKKKIMTIKRQRPDKSKSMDHSFYLSKVKVCLLALPAGAVKTSFPSSSSMAGGDAPSDPHQVLLPSPVSSRGKGGARPHPSEKGGLVTCFQGFQGDEADGGAAEGGGGYEPRPGADLRSEVEVVKRCSHRVLSIHFFERSSTLDMWFPTETAGDVWQVRWGVAFLQCWLYACLLGAASVEPHVLMVLGVVVCLTLCLSVCLLVV